MTEQLSAGMTLIFRASFHQAKLSNAFHDALVSLLYKSGKNDKSNPENYRPIWLTSVSCELLQHIIHSNAIEHFDHNNINASAVPTWIPIKTIEWNSVNEKFPWSCKNREPINRFYFTRFLKSIWQGIS